MSVSLINKHSLESFMCLDPRIFVSFSFLARIHKEEADNLRVGVRATALCMCFGHCIMQCIPS